MRISRRKVALSSIVAVIGVIASVLCLSACVPRDQSADDAARATDSVTKTESASIPGAVTIKNEPYRWNTGETWNYRILWTDRERMGASYNGKVGGAQNYANAIQTGAAHRLDFGVQVCVLEVVPGFKWWATEYRVLVLKGPLKGTEGWVDFDAINAGANPGVQSPGVGCDQR